MTELTCNRKDSQYLVNGSKCQRPCISFDKPDPKKYACCDWYCKYTECYDPNPDYIELYDALREELGSRDQAIRFLRRINDLLRKFNPDGFPEHLLPKAYEIREKLKSPLLHGVDLPLQFDSGLVTVMWTILNVFITDENGDRRICS